VGLNPAQIFMASTAVRELRVALSNTFLYASGNTMVGQSIERFLASLDGLFGAFPSITLGESEGRLVVEGTALNEKTTGSTNMIKDLFATHKLHSLSFLKGVTAGEVRALFDLLKPKGLPTGLSLSQALVQASLAHVKANEKVFVALQEGEKVVTASEAGQASRPPAEENLQEALEALQYFLQIFTKVRPDNNKREVARRMVENMGGWLTSGTGEGTKGSGGWKDVLGGFQALRDGLGSVKDPAQMREAKEGLEEMMRKLVSLGDSQGVELGKVSAPSEAPVPAKGPESKGAVQTILDAVGAGKWEVFWDSALEADAAQALSTLQEPGRTDHFGNLWKALWKRVQSNDGKTQAFALRHLNRLHWDKLPRALQLEGLVALREFIVGTGDGELYPYGLSLLQDWLPQEMVRPDWREVREAVKALQGLAAAKRPDFPKQDLAAQVALETIFCDPVLEALRARWSSGGPEAQEVLGLFVALGEGPARMAYGKAFTEEPGSPVWVGAVDLLAALSSAGSPVYADWLSRQENLAGLERFLGFFERVPLDAAVADFLERRWNGLSNPVQLSALGLIEKWKRVDFRPVLLNLLGAPEKPQALTALRVLGRVGMEGDGSVIVAAVRNYPSHGKGREGFWIAACAALGELGDHDSIGALREWADKYKFLEHKKDRGLEVRRAALEALGHFKTPEVRAFLEGLRKDIEKELLPTLERASK